MSEKRLLEEAYRRFLDDRGPMLEPPGHPLPYGICTEIGEAGWPHFIGTLIADNLREQINLLNAWGEYLADWSTWIAIVRSYKAHEAWTIRYRLVEPVVLYCMLQPSANRDRLGEISTSAIHQANLATGASSLDQLDQDRHPNRHLSRKASENQLQRIGARWANSFRAFQIALRRLDSPDYRETTRNFRNLASHGIAPHFDEGITSFVVRIVGPASRLIKQEDGSFEFAVVPDSRAVSYGFGGQSPLRLEEIESANRKEYELAVAAFKAYQGLLRDLCLAIELANSERITT